MEKQFHINPIKRCCLFPKQGICKNFTEEQISRYCCTSCNNNGFPKGAFVGRNLGFEYTPESNCDWKWTRCDDKKDNWDVRCNKPVKIIPRNDPAFMANTYGFDCGKKINRNMGVM